MLIACGRIGYEVPDGDTGGGDPYAETVLAANPVAYFRFDEAGGSTARSLVGGLSATYEGTFSFGKPGIAGNACAEFDNATTRVVLGDVFPFAGNAAHTLEAWVRPAEAFTDTRFIFNRGPSEGYTVYTGATYTLYARTTGGTEFCYSAGDGLPANAWTHVVATYDGSASRFYLDGVQTGANIGSPGPIGQIATPLVIGDSSGGQFYKFHGCIDEVAIYGRALDASEVAMHHTLGAP
jgi:hypothetical protein